MSADLFLVSWLIFLSIIFAIPGIVFVMLRIAKIINEDASTTNSQLKWSYSGDATKRIGNY
jgi:hypothetical protein